MIFPFENTLCQALNNTRLANPPTSHFSRVKNNYTYHTRAYRARVLHISDLKRLNFEKKTCRAPREGVTAVITMPRPVTAVIVGRDGH